VDYGIEINGWLPFETPSCFGQPRFSGQKITRHRFLLYPPNLMPLIYNLVLVTKWPMSGEAGIKLFILELRYITGILLLIIWKHWQSVVCTRNRERFQHLYFSQCAGNIAIYLYKCNFKMRTYLFLKFGLPFCITVSRNNSLTLFTKRSCEHM
jgi:hypothetical protein